MLTRRQIIVQEAIKRTRLVNGKPICGYVMGATGWICTQARLEAQAKQYPQYAEAIFKYGPQWLGKNCYDCAQLVRTCAKLAGYNLVSGATSQWTRTTWQARGPISTLPLGSLGAGVMLFKMQPDGKMSHVAICLGDGTEAEALGHQSGCVRRTMLGRTFTHWAQLPNLDEPYAPTTPTPPTEGGPALQAIVDTSSGTGGRLNIRSGPGTQYSVVARAPNNSPIMVLAKGEEWSQVAEGYTMTKYLRFTTASDGGSTPDPSSSTSLTLGDKGPRVKDMQVRLLVHGRALPKFGTDGNFGNETLVAVKQFQGLNGLVVDGIVGVATWEALQKEPDVTPPAEIYRVTIPNLSLVAAEILVMKYAGARKEIM